MHNQQLKEQISALVDGEHEDHELDLLLRSMADQDSKEDWELYHRIGDILHSDDLAVPLSSDFALKMQQRLASEPTYIVRRQTGLRKFNHKIMYATAATVALIAIFAPKFAGHDGAEVSAPYYAAQFTASTNLSQPAALVSMSGAQNTKARPNANPQMLRDPQIDSYLAAHQRYSKSMYSAVEYETGPINQEVEK